MLQVFNGLLDQTKRKLNNNWCLLQRRTSTALQILKDGGRNYGVGISR